MNSAAKSDFCVVIPAYMEESGIRAVVRRALEFCDTVAVIDDGSSDDTAGRAREAGAVVVRHESNRGKGAALQTAFAYVLEREFEFAITMDGDGQHDPADIPAFVEAYKKTGMPVLVGNRMDRAGGMPFVRRLTNRFMSGLLSRKMGRHVPDTQCGYRLYSRAALEAASPDSGRFAAESELLLHLADKGMQIGSVPIAVIYGDEKSKISPVKDTARFFAMLRKYDRSRRTVAPDK